MNIGHPFSLLYDLEIRCVMTIRISERLKAIANYLPKGAFFADIGTDHAYLPCFVCLQDEEARAIATEVKNGPYERALQTIDEYELNDVITVRLGDGLTALQPTDLIKQLVIAGMGGLLMQSILAKGQSQIKTVERIILQPNVGAEHVRQWLFEHDYGIVSEGIIKEKEHIYEIIVADYLAEQPYHNDAGIKSKEMLFGPLLLRENAPVFQQKWKHELANLRNVVEQMKKAQQKSPKKNKYIQKINWIEEVLSNGSFKN